jgi:DNA polymerase-1
MSSGTVSGKLYLVDAHSLIFQVFHAIPGMTSPTGMPTNALFGFVRDLLFLRSLEPDYLLCAFDRAEPTFRTELYPDYKAHREAVPDDLQIQIPLIYRAVEALSIPALDVAGYEADDILATVAQVASARGLEVFLCTADKDCRQLIDERVRLYNLRKRTEFGRVQLLEDWGIEPGQVVDLQSLVGDSVDNVPGVPGIGVKTAAKLLQEFGTLENILANVDRISGAKRQENLRAAGPIVEMSRKLVRLAADVPINFDWEGWRVAPIHTEQMLALCREWGFHSLAGQVRALAKSSVPTQRVLFRTDGEEMFPFGANAPEAVEASAEPGRAGGVNPLNEKPGRAGAVNPLSEDTASESLAPQGVNTPNSPGIDTSHSTPQGPTMPEKWQAIYRLIDTPAAFKELMAGLSKQKRFAIDLETTSLEPRLADIVGIALCWKAGEAFYLATRGPAGSDLLNEQEVMARLKPILEDPTIAKVNQNIKYDLLVLRALGIDVKGITGDPMVADYLLHAGERSHGMEDMARRYLDHQVIPITDLIGKKSRKQPQLNMDQVPTARVAEYSGEDADVAWRLAALLEPQLAAAGLARLYDELEIPLVEVLAEMEFNGIRLDVPRLKRLGEEMAAQLAAIEKETYALAGHEFNIGSLPQLRKVLFEELSLPVQGRTGVTGEPSTDQESLEKLAALDHLNAKLPRKILEQRQIAKLKSTYVDALPTLVNPRTGRVHTSFNQTVAATGRLSSADPNLQNIPVRRDMGQQIRQAFVPEEGWQLLTADYSQIELRLLAHFCGDEELRQAFADERDVHTTVAAQIFGVAEESVNPDQRRMAKTVNFGVIYGMSATGLAQRLQIPRGEAAAFITAYFKRYPRVEVYQAHLLAECRRTGMVSTILGRRRHFDPTAIRATTSYRDRIQPEREAINMEIQGSAADLIKLAMLEVYRRLRQEKMRARMLLQIHDELVFEAPPEEMPSLVDLVRREMTTPVEKRLDLRVPLRVDLAVGPNWLDVAEMTR